MNEKLIQAVKDQISDDEDEALEVLADVRSAADGVSGFIYYSDTCKFFEDNQREIVEMAKEMADDFGQDVVSMIARFGCLTDDRETRDEIGQAVYGKYRMEESESTNVPNALAWFALKEVARFVTDN